MKFCPSCNQSFDDSNAFCPTDGEVLQESPESIVGQVIEGKYKIESFIAQGGMGAVYRARHILLGDEVVIKTLRSEMRNNSEWLRRFQREGKAARAFRHPNSVTVYDLSTGGDGLIYMVMEYVEGHTLDKELKSRARFTPAEALEVLEPVADVLDAAHARGVVHRDLKPENIMLGKTDAGHTVIKVLDLGIAKMVGAGEVHAAEATSLTVAGQILGTPYYMSPEQWGEMPRDGRPEVDGRTDIYSLGVIFFELVAGKKPLGGRTLSELRQKHVAAPMPYLHILAPDVPEEFSRAVARAMAKDRGDRPQKAGELVAELRAALGLPQQGRAGAFRATDPGWAGRTGETGVVEEAATGRPMPAGGTDALEQSRAATLMTSEQALAATPEARATSADGSPVSTAALNSDADPSRPTVIVGPSAETRAGYQDSVIRQDSVVMQTRIAPPAAAENGSAAAAIPPPFTSPAPAPSRSAAPIVAGGALVVLLLVAGVGGWLFYRNSGTDDANVTPPDAPAPANAAGPSSPSAPAPAPAAKAEVVGYWFQTFDSKDAATGQTVVEQAPTLPSGKFFTFNFRAPVRGYLYIVGPTEGNALTTLLTAKGTMGSKSNLVGANADFVFPPGGVKFELDRAAGAEDFTVIFSPTPLLAPKFLSEEFGRVLSPSELKELEELRAQGGAGAATREVTDEGGARRVAVSLPRDAASGGRPVVFDVRINHK
jgi:eukaryotic-like serine/threonine-protein kinase